jgi:peroxiredoxin
MALESKKGSLNSKIIDFNLLGIDNNYHSLKEYDNEKILIIIFMCNHCPYVKAVMGRLVEIQKKYLDKGVKLIGINPNDEITYPEDSFENMKLFAKEYNMNFPYLRDETQNIAKEYDAACTPDIYVYDSNRFLKYHGRIDDNWKDENLVTQKELEKAIDFLLAGENIEFDQIPSLGCSIKWK